VSSSRQDYHERSLLPLIGDRFNSNQVTVMDLMPAIAFPVNDLQLERSKAKSTPINLSSQKIQIPIISPGQRNFGDLRQIPRKISYSANNSIAFDESEVICDEDVHIHFQSKKWENKR